MTAQQILALVARSTFLPMDETDFSGFAGVQNDNALICYGADYTLILDGDRVCYINGDWEESQFVLGEDILGEHVFA